MGTQFPRKVKAVKTSRHCRRYRCRHVVGCVCNCKACAKLRPEDERAAWQKSRDSVKVQSNDKGSVKE